MNFFLIRDIEDEHCNGVILESEDQQYGARLAGKDGVDDPARVIPYLISKNSGRVDTIVPGESGTRKKLTLKVHQPGYMEALLRNLNTPLVLFRRGRIQDVNTPEEMTSRLWKRFGGPDTEMPRYQPLRPAPVVR